MLYFLMILNENNLYNIYIYKYLNNNKVSFLKMADE